MKIEIRRVAFQEMEGRISVDVIYSEEQPSGVWHSASVTIFLDWNDSYAEIKRQALEKANAFLLHAASDR